MTPKDDIEQTSELAGKLPFFLRNRNLAHLVLDHFDHVTIGNFRLICKQADQCVRSAFFRTSTFGYVSSESMGSILGRAPDAITAKMQAWVTIAINDVDGLVELASIFDDTARVDLVLPKVTTVILNDLFIERLLLFQSTQKLALVSLTKITHRINPTNLCIASRQIALHPLPHPLTALIPKRWPLQHVTWHWFHPHQCMILPHIPHHLIYGHVQFPMGQQAYSPEQVPGVKTITFCKRLATLRYIDHTSIPAVVVIESQDSKYCTEDVVMEGPGGVQYIFPAESAPCPCCHGECRITGQIKDRSKFVGW